MAPWAQGPSERPVRFVVPPLGFSATDAWRVASPIQMGIVTSRYEGSFLPTPSLTFVRLMLLPIGVALLKHWCSQPRVGTVLMMDLAPGQGSRRAVHNSPGSTTAKSGRNLHLGEHRPRPDGTVG